MAVKAYLRSSHPTSIVHLKSISLRSKPDSPLFIWIPGNPGLIDYYEEFLMLLHRQYPHWEVLGISHAGMSSVDAVSKGGSHQSEIYSLEQQIEHKLSVIRDFSSINRPLIIMGHSVGAYMVQHIATSDDLVGKVIKLGLLTPTIIDIHTSEKGQLLTKALYWLKGLPQIAAWGSSLLFNGLLPAILVKPILAILMGCSRHSNSVLTSERLVKNSAFVKQALGLASFEMEEIRGDWDFQRKFIECCNKKNIALWFLFSDSDHWVANDTREHLIEFFSDNYNQDKIKIDISREVPHSFVLKHSKYLVDNYFNDS